MGKFYMNMKRIGIGCAGLVVLVLVIGFILGLFLWHQRGEAIALEEQIEAQLKTNESNYDNMWKRFKEMTQVTDLQADQIKEVYDGLIQGRYQDQDLLFQAVQEQNPNLNGEVYTKLQNEISTARIKFDNNQKKIVDIIAEYNRLIKHRGIVMAMITGRDAIDSDDYIILSEETNKAFDSGNADEIDLKEDSQ
jgi:uncharacterized membrane-anchored protein YhcB (DUF1043 family)